jgi:putative transposase
MLLAHRIRIDATAAQRDYFARAAGTARRVWNWALAEWNRQAASGRRPNAMALKKAFNRIKYLDPDWLDADGKPWLRAIHRDAHAQPFANLAKAWSRYYEQRRTGQPAHAPRFKKKGRSPDGFYLANDKFRLDGRGAVLPKVGRIVLREALRWHGKIMGASVSRQAGHWYLAVQVDVPDHLARRRRTGDAVTGVDLGVTSAATLSSGEKIAAPRPLKAALRRLRIRSRRQSRKLEAAKAAAGIVGRITKGTRLQASKNRTKGALALARLQARIARVRRDFTHKLTTRLCRENQTVVIEKSERARHAGQCAPGACDRRRRALRIPPPAALQGRSIRHAPRAGRPLVPVQQTVFGLRYPQRGAGAGRAHLDLRRLRRAARPRRERGHQPATARHRRPRGAHGATRGEPCGNAWRCRWPRAGGRRGSHACQARARSAGRLGAGRERSAHLHT